MSCQARMMDYYKGLKKLLKKRLACRNYLEAAYLKGRLVGLVLFLTDMPLEQLPVYFLFGHGDIFAFEQFAELLKDAEKIHKSAHRVAESYVIKENIPDNLHPHHPPFF